MPTHSRTPDQRGASAVEMALILPLLLIVVFAIIDYSRFFFIRSTVTAAVADAARIAVLPGATDAMVAASIAAALLDPISQDGGHAVFDGRVGLGRPMQHLLEGGFKVGLGGGEVADLDCHGAKDLRNQGRRGR